MKTCEALTWGQFNRTIRQFGRENPMPRDDSK
jgi:hypothetical protein